MQIRIKTQPNDTPSSVNERLRKNWVFVNPKVLALAAGVSKVDDPISVGEISVYASVRDRATNLEEMGVLLQRAEGHVSSSNSLLSTQIRQAQDATNIQEGTISPTKTKKTFPGSLRRRRAIQDFFSSALRGNSVDRAYARLNFFNRSSLFDQWNINRDLLQYADKLGEFRHDFFQRIAAHTPNQIYGDLGAGKALAAEQLLQTEVVSENELKQAYPSNPTLAHVVHWLFDKKDPGVPELFERVAKTETSLAFFNYKNPVGMRLRRIKHLLKERNPESKVLSYTGDFHKIDMQRVPKMDMLTDIIGIATYSPDFGRYLEQVHHLLTDDGVFYCALSERTKFFVQTRSGRKSVKACDFFKHVPGFHFADQGDELEGYKFVLTKSGKPFGNPRIEVDGFRAPEDMESDPTPHREITAYVDEP